MKLNLEIHALLSHGDFRYKYILYLEIRTDNNFIRKRFSFEVVSSTETKRGIIFELLFNQVENKYEAG